MYLHHLAANERAGRNVYHVLFGPKMGNNEVLVKVQ